MNFLNGFITANQDRMDQFVQTLSLPVKQLPEVAIPIEFSVTDYQMMEKLLTNVNVVVSLLKAPDVEPFTKLAQELQFYRALESLNVDQLNDGQTVKLKVVLETSDHAYETELEGPGSVVGSLVPGFLKTLEAAKKKIGKREKTSSLHPATSKVFGTALSDVLLTQSTTNPLALASGSLSMPKFIEAVIQELFLRGMESEGIFRLTGSTPKVQELKEYINKGDVPDFSTEDVNNLASLIKYCSTFFEKLYLTLLLKRLYFKELPEPLVTDQKYESFMNVAGF